MKKTFLKSVVTGIVGLTIASGCSVMGKKESAHKCSSNSCKAKKESHDCRAKKDSHSCKTKSRSNTCKGQR